MKVNQPSSSVFQGKLIMTQAHLQKANYRILWNEDQIKKEIEDTCTLVCNHCRVQETIDIRSIRNTSPFRCSSCDASDENHTDERTISSYASTTTTQARSTYYMHFSYPETIVTTRIVSSYSYLFNK
jgi:hypothetical protein